MSTAVSRNLKGADLLGGKTDALLHVSLGGKEMKTKVSFAFLLDLSI
jgi:hypothetical protein